MRSQGQGTLQPCQFRMLGAEAETQMRTSRHEAGTMRDALHDSDSKLGPSGL